MKTNNNDKISPLQYTFLVSTTLLGAGILSMPRGVTETAGTDAWLVTIAGGLIILFITYLLHKLALLFPQDTFVTFSQKIVGKWLGIALSVLFGVYFFVYTPFEARLFGEISKIYILDQTPLETVVFIYLWVSLVSTRKGIEGIARLCQILFPIIVLLIILLSFLSTPKLDFNNFLPLLNTPWQTLTKSLFTTSLVYLGFEIILFLTPSLAKPQNAIKNGLLGVSIIIGLYSCIVIITIAILGVTDTQDIYWPVISAIEQIDLPGGIFERFESLLLSLWALAVFTSSIVFTYLTAYIPTLITGFREFKPLLCFMMPFFYWIALIPHDVTDVFAMGDFLGKNGFLFVTTVPVFLLIIAKIRNKGTRPNAVKFRRSIRPRFLK